MSDRTELIEVIAKLTDDAASATEFLQELITNPTLSSDVKIKLVGVDTILNLQNHLIRQMGELQMIIEDKVDDLLTQLEKQ